jgi:hypothetical protein
MGGIIGSNLSPIPPNPRKSCSFITMRLCPQTSPNSESMREKNAISNPGSYTLQMATTNNNDNLLNQITEAENAHDIEKLIALVTDDIVIEDVPFVPFGMVMRGKDGVRQGYAFFFEAAPDYKVEPKSWVTSDNPGQARFCRS